MFDWWRMNQEVIVMVISVTDIYGNKISTLAWTMRYMAVWKGVIGRKWQASYRGKIIVTDIYGRLAAAQEERNKHTLALIENT